VTADVVAQAEACEAMPMAIWDLSEMGYQEHKSSALLQARLADNGFTVIAGVACIPTAFVVTYGSGDPVIGILAEFNALPLAWAKITYPSVAPSTESRPVTPVGTTSSG
jgi:aminobenzoyl-glutamate utilization protein B